MWNITELPGKFVNFKKLYSDTDKILQNFGTNFDSRTLTGDLKVAQQQVVEIARAISMNARLVIFDEPTSSLTESETDNLFNAIRKLKESGVGIVYISHRMPELFEICDSVTVLRDGKFVGSMAIKDVTPDDVILKMVGRDIGDYYPKKSVCITDKELLKVEGLTGEKFRNVSFTLRKGEILGFSGLVGAGRTEVMQSICGFIPYEKGSVTLQGQKIHANMRSKEIIKHGLFYLTEDRKKNGLFLPMSTRRNISVTVLDMFSHFGFLKNNKEKQISKQMIKNMDIRVASDEISAGSVSGGNQQKMMISKWLVANPKVLLMDEPTRGIDVGSKSEIHHKLRKLCNDGIGVIVVSSEMPEIIGLCDRVIVMHEGIVVGEVSGENITEENLVLLASNRIKKGI
jgi:ribose transport system ATP-binding protein